MRALYCRRYGEFADLELIELPSPPMRQGGVRIRVNFASVSFGIGMAVAGKHQKKTPLPFVPGNEISGVVTEVAAGVDRIKSGDRVVARLPSGGYAEEVVAPEETVYTLPSGVDIRAATSLPLSYGTAFSGLFWQGDLKPGETLLVHGAAGALGLAAVQIGRVAGAYVIATASTETKRALVKAHGAHEALAPDSFRDAVKSLTGGSGVDIVFDTVGGHVFDDSLRAVRPQGRIVVAGFASGTVPKIPANILLVKNVKVFGHYFGLFVGDGATDESRRHAPRVQEMMTAMFGWLARGQIAPVISNVFPLGDYAAAMESIVSRRSTGKVLLEVSASVDAE
jgi:NADPH2:quinone reductase